MAKNSILIVDDEPLNIKTLSKMLTPDYTVYAEKDGTSCLDTAKKLQPDLIVLDVVMPNINGFQVIEQLKQDHETQSIPVIFVTGLANPESEVQGFSLGAADYICKPFIAPIVKMRIQNQIKIINLVRKVQNLSITDALTGIGNRRYFNAQLPQEWDHAKREQLPMSFLIFDLDNFKNFNDTYGHLNGDTALQTVAHVLTTELKRATDKVARWGVEEFAVILPNTDLNGAKLVAENLREAIASTPVPLSNNTFVHITVSIGAHCMVPPKAESYSISEFVSDADKALYEAKKSGKNRVVAFE